MSAALTAAMLAAGGVALAGDPAKTETQSGTSTEETELQSGSEKMKSHSLSDVSGEQARQLQEGLKEQGFYDGEVDGVLGPITKKALKKFQESKGFDASGKLDSQTASALGIEISDVQPVRGTEEPVKDEQPSTDPAKPEPEATPMSNSGSTTTPDTGLDEAGTGADTDMQSGSETETPSGSETSTGSGTETPSGSETETSTGSETETPSGSETSAGSETETQSGEEEAGAEPLEGDLEKDKEPVSGEDETDLQSGEASDEATGTGSMNTGADEEILEPGQHPASENQPIGGVEGQDDPNVVNDSEIEPQAGTSTTFDKKTIKQVEKALKKKNLFTGKVDGILDTDTTEAIRKFQTDNGIVVTGQLDARTLDALGVKSGADTKIDMQGGGSTDPGEMATPAPGETPVPGEPPTEPIDPPNPNDPVQPNPGDVNPQ